MSNNLLTDKLYLQSLGYKDIHYLESLCQSIWEFIKNTPIFIFSNVYKDQQGVVKIKLSVGDKSKVYRIDNSIHIYDFIYILQKFLKPLYPQFEFEEEVDYDLDVEEMLQTVANTGISLKEAVFLKKKILLNQKGIILKIFLSKDEFLLDYNGIKSIRTTVFSNNFAGVLLVSQFIKNVRNLYYNKASGKEIRDYIINNSKEIRILSKNENDIIVDYPLNMMKNFFRLHFLDLLDSQLEKITHLYYKWGRYCIMFSDEKIENECISYYRNRKKKEIFNNGFNENG